MKDIDFDELDRAVSSALGNKSEPVLVGTPVELSAPTVPDVAETVPTVVTSTIMRGQVSPAVRRGGRFMDVVHPSSDMKASAPTALRVPKRTFEPISDDLKSAPVPATTPAPVEPKSTPDESFPTLDTLSDESSPRMDVGAKESEASILTHTWPDPLDMKPLEKTADQEVTELEDTQEPSAEPEMVPSSLPAEDSTQTPFLTDAKVDKRPLGAFAEYEPGAEKLDTVTTLEGSTSVESPELAADLVAIESNGMPNIEEEPDAKPIATPSVDASGATPPASIAQQYNAVEKSSNTDVHSVFDTSTYHQPLLPQKTHHKNKLWLWVLIIIGLLVVGAGLGALLFMAGL